MPILRTIKQLKDIDYLKEDNLLDNWGKMNNFEPKNGGYMNVKSSEMILNEDGSIYHLKLLPHEVADDVILVGDPARVDLISKKFDHIEFVKYNREFKTVTGTYNKKRITIVSSGIGPDNIDIVINELDALKNIDLNTGNIKDSLQSMNILRIGTSGSLQEDISPGTAIISKKSIGFDNLAHFYAGIPNDKNRTIAHKLKEHLQWNQHLPYPYVTEASENLIQHFQDTNLIQGWTVSAPGFYGPQGRKLRIDPLYPEINHQLKSFHNGSERITNYEMESSAVYLLSGILHHHALTICLVIANRMTHDFIQDYEPFMDALIAQVLETLVKKTP